MSGDRWLEAELRNRRKLWSTLVGSGAPEAGAWKRDLLAFASETPDNSACLERFEVGELPPGPGDRRGFGLRLKGSGASLSDVAHELENAVDVDALEARFPEFAAEDWEALLRLITLLFSALERPGSEAPSEP